MSTTIKLVGADERFSASIAQLLKLKTKDSYVIDIHGDITLIDADSVEGRKSAEGKLDDHTIILTVLPEQFQHPFIVKKPIKVDELLMMLEKIVKLPMGAQVVKQAPEKVSHQNEVTGNPFAKFMKPDYLAQQKKERATKLENEKSNSIENLSKPAVITPEAKPAVITPEAKPAVITPEAKPAVIAPEAKPEVMIPKAKPKIIKSGGLYTEFSSWQEKIKESKGLKRYYFDDIFEQLTDIQSNEMANLYSRSEEYNYSMSEYASLMLFTKIVKGSLVDKICYVETTEGVICFFSDGIFLSNLSVEQIVDFSKCQKSDIAIKTIESYDAFVKMLGRFDRYFYEDALVILSRIILLEAKGRIINGQDIKEPLGLMRLDDGVSLPILMPYSKVMDNIWCFRNVSLRDTAELLADVNPYHIFSYYTLCCLCGFFNQTESSKKSNKHLDLNTLLSELQKL